jgi:hypothetical protein
MPIEYLGFGFSALCLILAVYCALRLAYFNQRFLAYLKQNHYPKWNDFIGEDITDQFKHLGLTPLNSKKSFYHFVFRSSDDFGDRQVKDFKRQIRYGAYGFIINAIAGVSSFGMTGFILSQLRH